MLRDRYSEARYDDQRERVSGWIDEERRAIEDIDEKLVDARRKLDEARAKLRDE